MEDRIRAVLSRVGRLRTPVPDLEDEGDLHEAGLTSFGTVELILALEEEFGLEVPEELIARGRFGSIRAIADTLRLVGQPHVADVHRDRSAAFD